jgi:hypothetical protein
VKGVECVWCRAGYDRRIFPVVVFALALAFATRKGGRFGEREEEEEGERERSRADSSR